MGATSTHAQLKWGSNVTFSSGLRTARASLICLAAESTLLAKCIEIIQIK